MKSAMGSQSHMAFIALITVAVLAEIAAAWLAYHTLGEIFSSLLYMAIALNLVPIALYLLRKKSAAFIIAVLLLLAIVPYQAVLGHRTLLLQQEAASLVAYLYETRLETGEFPANLSGFTFSDEGLRPFFHEYHRDAESGGFGLYWYIGTPNTSHFYTPRHGWGYYPD